MRGQLNQQKHKHVRIHIFRNQNSQPYINFGLWLCIGKKSVCNVERNYEGTFICSNVSLMTFYFPI